MIPALYVPLLNGSGSWVLSAGGTLATLDIDFVGNRAWSNGPSTVSSLLTITRASPGFYTKSDGTLQAFGDISRTNLALRSQEFDNSTWTNQIDNSVSANVTTAPDNTLTADKLISGTSTQNQELHQAFVYSNVNYTFSVYAKPAGYNFAFLQVFDGVVDRTAWFNLANGTVGSIGGPGTTSAITSLPNGWYRCSINFTPAANSQYFAVGTADVDAHRNFAGDGTSGIYFWGAQLEVYDPWYASPSTYIATTTVAVTVGAVNNVLRSGSNGLLVEESRTNQALRSQQFNTASWTATAVIPTDNSTVAPDGTTTAALLVPSTSNTRHNITNAAITTGGVNCALSCYFKAAGYSQVAIREDNTSGAYAAFSLSGNGSVIASGNGSSNIIITPLANGWYFCSLNITQNVMALGVYPLSGYVSGDPFSFTFAGDGVSGVNAWGAQFEAGAFPTSYIPTTTASATRGADQINFTSNSVFNTSAGTYFATTNLVPTITNARILDINNGVTPLSDNGSNNQISAFNGVQALNATFGSGTWAGLVKTALAYDAGPSRALCGNAGTVTTDANGLGTLGTVFVGSSSPGTQNDLNGYIRRLAFFNSKLSNATLQILTT